VVGVVAGDAAGGTRSAYDSIMDILRRRPEDASPVVAAKRIIMTHVACGNKQDEGVFKVAYVVYVLNFMLGNTVINYWPALFDHEKIDKYDWATCVVHEIMKGPLKSGGELSAGCKMFLQVCSTVLIYIHFSGLYRLLFIPSYTHNVLQKQIFYLDSKYLWARMFFPGCEHSTKTVLDALLWPTRLVWMGTYQ
jgi:hypothetical protein